MSNFKIKVKNLKINMIIKSGIMQAQVEFVLFEYLSGVQLPRVLCGTYDWLLVIHTVIPKM
jgi:hypothetical protein